MKKPPVVSGAHIRFYSVSRTEWRNLQKKAIKIWHFERSPTGRGVIPVAGKYDPSNPNHIKQRKIIHEHEA